jgi:hypothetical protein
MRELTLEQIGKEISAAAQQIPLAQRGSFADVMKSLHTPVGGLRRNK